MGFLNRRQATLTAAAAPVDLEVVDERAVRKREEWQERAWSYYDAIPEVWFSHNYVANALRRVRIFPAIIEDPDEPPVPLDPDSELGQKAEIELGRFKEGGTHGTLMHDLALQLSIPGDGWLALYKDETTGAERFMVASLDELRPKDKEWFVYGDVGYGEGQKLIDPSVNRVWRQHPRFKNKPDSAMQPLVVGGTLEELVLLDRNARGAAKSRIPNGMYLVPDEINFKRDPRAPQKNGHGFSPDPFVDEFIHMAVTPIQDDASAGAAVPGVLKVKGDLIEKFHYQTFGRSFGGPDAERYQVLLRKYASGVDMPLEVVLGVESLNHWSAWLITEESFTIHLAPLVELICSSITQAHLQKALIDVNDPRAKDVLVWYDASAITSHPGRGTDADNALKLGALSYPSYRKYRGYNEADAATEADIALLERVSVKSVTPPEQGPPQATITGAAGSMALRRTPLSTITYDLVTTERRIRTQLQAAAEVAVTKAIAAAGAKMRGKVVVPAALEDRYVCQVLGAETVYSFASNDELIGDEIDETVMPLYFALVGGAQKKVRNYASEYGEYDEPAYATRQDADMREGADTLKVALVGYVAGVMFAPDRPMPADRIGEYAPGVPPGFLRDSLAVAGGGRAAVNGATGTPEGGVTTGETARSILAQVNVTPVSWVWMYGDEGSRKSPFEGHLALDGVEFLDWQDPVLTVQPGDEWLGTDTYYPGDHLYCQCDFGPVLQSQADEEGEP